MQNPLLSLKVKIFADGADKPGMFNLYANPLIKGFTTNPTLMRKAGVLDYKRFALDVLQIVRDRSVSFEVFADDFKEMERQALEIAARAPHVDLVITDMIMPEHEGVETILRIRQLCPSLKILAMSGVNGRNSYLQLAAQIGASVTLEKAWIPDLLLASVHSLLQPA